MKMIRPLLFTLIVCLLTLPLALADSKVTGAVDDNGGAEDVLLLVNIFTELNNQGLFVGTGNSKLFSELDWENLEGITITVHEGKAEVFYTSSVSSSELKKVERALEHEKVKYTLTPTKEVNDVFLKNTFKGACACPRNLDPVCGKDQKTYANACNAECSDITILHKGECKVKDDTEQEPVEEVVEEVCTSNCMWKGECLSVGDRRSFELINSYCSEEGLVSQKEEGASCSSNYECKNERCEQQVCGGIVEEEPVQESTTIFGRFIGWITSLFG